MEPGWRRLAGRARDEGRRRHKDGSGGKNTGSSPPQSGHGDQQEHEENNDDGGRRNDDGGRAAGEIVLDLTRVRRGAIQILTLQRLHGCLGLVERESGFVRHLPYLGSLQQRLNRIAIRLLLAGALLNSLLQGGLADYMILRAGDRGEDEDREQNSERALNDFH